MQDLQGHNPRMFAFLSLLIPAPSSSAPYTQMALTFPCRVFNVPWMLNVFLGHSLDTTLPLLSRFGLSSTHGTGCKAICELSSPGDLCVGLDTMCSQLGRVGETSASTLGTMPHCASYNDAGGGCHSSPIEASCCPHSTQEYKGIIALPISCSALFFFYRSERDTVKAQYLSQMSSWREGNERGQGRGG